MKRKKDIVYLEYKEEKIKVKRKRCMYCKARRYTKFLTKNKVLSDKKIQYWYCKNNDICVKRASFNKK